MKLQNKLGLMLREARKSKKLTQFEVAEQLGYKTMQFVSLMERGLSKTPRPVLKKLIPMLGLNRSEILKMIQSDFSKQLHSEI